MFKNHRLAFCVFVVVVSAGLSGCVTTRSVSDVGFPLNDSVVYITAIQNELETEASSTNAMAAGGGLLGLLITHSIDSSRNRRAEEAVVELRDALIDFAIAEEFSERIIQSGLAGQLSLLDPKVLTEEPEADYQHQGDFLELHPKVQLSNDLSALEVSIWIRTFELNKRKRPIFAGFSQAYTYVHALSEPAAGNDRSDYAEAWLSMGSEALEELILFGMETAVETARQHLQQGDAGSGTGVRYRVPDYSNRIKYHVWHETVDLLWLRVRPTSNEIIITPRGAVVQAG